ncbi:Na(+)/H(+) antiporter [Gracilibacillus boraciitolerans JCM 21714]|uniref:Na(+)/H(+) antiporter n=1 Tax=Gracilibacillus boraciitolerans JCM 21714 TaxID=1298598 RepID=W4VJ81_9BACI|nr:Na+/H+ antiporter NhaC [Gracilibacillus boraciitolerans]GAE93272.1 Na(+)/H(+) antiporter [Gracilibacillus boraciitolerans JCM 21714]
MKNDTTNRPSVGSALVPIAMALAILIIGIGILKYPAELMLLFAGIVFAIFSVLYGHKWESIIETMGSKIKKALPAILILFCIGLLIGTWMISGTIPLFVYYGLEIINPNYLYLIAFLVTAIVSTCVGTSWGSAGTIGVAIMSIAQTMDLSLAITAGAVVSGAYFGDKLSPLSDTTNMSSIAAGSNLYEHIKHMLYTAVPSSILAIIVFTVVGFGMETDSSQLSNIQEMSAGLDQLFNLNLLLLLPAVVVIVGSLMKKPPLIVLFSSSVIAMILGLVTQGASFANIFASAVSGFNVDMLGAGANVISEDLQSLLNRGGLYSMYNATFFVFVAFFFASALEISQALNIILESILAHLKTIGSITLSSLITGFAVINCTSNALVSYFLVQDIYGKVYKKKNLHPVNLSRNMEDSITITEVLMPWQSQGFSWQLHWVLATSNFYHGQFLTLADFYFQLYMGFLLRLLGGDLEFANWNLTR